jgi:hypothetical protein
MRASPVARSTARSLGTLLLGLSSFVACADSPTDPDRTPLTGLTATAISDSLGNAPPPPAGVAGPGTFHGTVIGPSPIGAGGDTLATAPRVPFVRVAAFPFLGMDGSTPQLGPEEAAVFTDLDGRFQLPLLVGGEYVVTFTPGPGSNYGGVWSTATAHASSNAHPWWVVLWLK